ncbi:MAG: type II secretion system protein GspK, partial [Planctomycetota bacterium]
DVLTTDTAEIIPGRINVNQAPAQVLAGIPGMTEEVLQEILYGRPTDPSAVLDPEWRYPTWLLTEGIVTRDQMKALMPYVTGGGSVFRGQAVGFFDDQGPTARIEVVLDATSAPPRIIFWRDMTHLGRGYSPEILGAEIAGF